MTSLRRALLALGALAVLIGIGAAALILNSDHVSDRGLEAGLILAAGWSFAFTGLYAWDRRPANRIGPLMTAIGFTWFIKGLVAADHNPAFLLGAIFASLPYAILAHLLLSFPSGRLETRLQRWLAAGAYLLTTVGQLAWALFTDPAKDGCEGCPENPILVESGSTLGGVIDATQVLAAVALIAASIVVVFLRWRRSEAAQRRALSPIVLTGSLAFTFAMTMLIVDQAELGERPETVAYVAQAATFTLMPFAFLIGLLRSRIGRAEEVSSALTIENEQLTAELQAKVEELRASRHRIVEAGYAERRRVERDLHDGAQQRLMALTMTLRLAREKLEAEPASAAGLLDEAMEELGTATAELREFARGIHPVVLSDRGLGAALGGLADRSPLPVEIVETPTERLPAPVESATYFVVAEALTNVARYAEAEVATVRVGRQDGAVEIEVSDDGIGGADPSTGTGLRGLADRVAALDGSFAVRSEAGAGTTVEARIPCG